MPERNLPFFEMFAKYHPAPALAAQLEKLADTLLTPVFDDVVNDVKNVLDKSEDLLQGFHGTAADTRDLLAAAINVLSPREKQIITLRFGLGGGKEQTQKEVADQLGISQSYISRLEKRIISRLKKEILRLS